MKTSLQVQKAVAKAMQTPGMLKKSFKFLSRDLFLFLYRNYIRPHEEIKSGSFLGHWFKLSGLLAIGHVSQNL